MSNKIGPADAVILRWVADVTAAARSGDWSKAIRWADHAISLGLYHPQLLHMRAIGHERAGRLAQARADLEQGHALDRDDVAVANALGVHLTRARAYERACEVLRLAVAAQPDLAVSRLNLGSALMLRGELAAAEASFTAAAALDPADAAAAGKLATLASHRGDRAAARAAAAQALASDPLNSNARRALIESDLDEQNFDAAEGAARDWLCVAALGPNARHHALGLLGDALDGLRRPAEAFAAYDESNAAFRAAHARGLQELQARPISKALAGFERDFAALPAERWTPARATGVGQTGDPRSHIFLMGFMRSGTTLLEQALARHDDVAALEETEALADAADAFLGAPGGLGRLAALEPEEADRYRAAYWAAVRAAGVEPAGKVFLDKLPFNGIKLPLIVKLFPEARVIFALRDPRDVVFSCFQRRLQANAYAYELSTLQGAAGLYDAYMSLVRSYRANLRLRIVEHRHETLVEDIEGALRAVCDDIGLDFRPHMIAFGGAARAGRVASQSARQLQGGVTPKGVGRWRAYEAQLAPVLPILEPWARAFGYEPD